jgi:TolB-like protein/Flp pilus assembly protein TadD
VVGYSRLMGRDESGTLARLREHRQQRLEPVLGRHSGRLVKLTGDGALVEFPSAVDALSAAIEFQQAMAEANLQQPEDTRIVFRLGLHLGDLIVEGDDLYGDGVNVAARLEAEAPPGGIVVSRAIREAVEGRLKATLNSLGELTLKNIERPIRAFSVEWDESDWKRASATESELAPRVATAISTLALPDKPSIAVLPFQNMSGDPEQEYFVDGLVEDIITALSRFKSLFVIARNSSFTYKGKAVDIKQVGRELGVRYVLEGSVRKAGDRVRITGQLIDSQTGAHLWADRFDSVLADVFDLQDRITSVVAGQLPAQIEQAEIGRLRTRPTSSMGAYDSFLLGMKNLHVSTRESVAEALRHFYRAIELDPEYVEPRCWAVVAYSRRKQGQWMIDVRQESAKAVQLARRAVELEPDNPFALGNLGFALAYMAGETAAGIDFINRSLALNPNDAQAWHGSGWVRCYNGDYDLAIEHIGHAERLSPLDPQTFQFDMAKGLAHFHAGRYEVAAEIARSVIQRHPELAAAYTHLARSAVMAGQIDEGRQAMAQALRLNPNISISALSAISVSRRPEDRQKLLEAYRLAGMPE